MNNQYFVIFKCREKMRIKTYEFKTRRDALDYFRLFYEPDSEDLYYSIIVSEFDAHQKIERLLAPSRLMKKRWKTVFATVVWTFLPQRILLPSCWYFLRWMRMINSASFRTFGYRKIHWSFESDETMSLTMSGNDKAFWRQLKEMSSTTVTSRNSSSDLENVSILER